MQFYWACFDATTDNLRQQWLAYIDFSLIFLSEAPAGDDSDGGEEDMTRVLMLAY